MDSTKFVAPIAIDVGVSHTGQPILSPKTRY